MRKILLAFAFALPSPALADDFYVIETTPSGTVAYAFSGQSQAQVQAQIAVLADHSYQFVTKAVYDAAVASAQIVKR